MSQVVKSCAIGICTKNNDLGQAATLFYLIRGFAMHSYILQYALVLYRDIKGFHMRRLI